MKNNVIAESGIIGIDGKFRLPMDRLNAYFAENKGKRVMVRFETAEPGTSAALLGYYYNYVVPTIRTALYETGERLTEDQTDAFLLSNYPGDTDRADNNGGALYGRQLNQRQMLDFLDWLKQYAAENLYVYIEDPKSI